MLPPLYILFFLFYDNTVFTFLTKINTFIFISIFTLYVYTREIMWLFGTNLIIIRRILRRGRSLMNSIGTYSKYNLGTTNLENSTTTLIIVDTLSSTFYVYFFSRWTDPIPHRLLQMTPKSYPLLRFV